MPPLTISRLGHANNIVGNIDDLREAYSGIFGADFFRNWTNPAVGSANSLLLVGDTCVEIFGVVDPRSVFGRYVSRYGPGWHSLEWTVPSQLAAEEIAAERNIRVSDRAEGYAWLHPKDCHGLLLEVSEAHFAGDSRDVEGWTPSYWADEHPLGIVALDCIRALSAAPLKAAEWLAELTGTDVSYDEVRPDIAGRAVGVGLPGHVLEFLGPDGNGQTQDMLSAHGGRIHSVAFAVKDLDGAVQYLDSKGVATTRGTEDGRVFLDTASTAGSVFELVPGR